MYIFFFPRDKDEVRGYRRKIRINRNRQIRISSMYGYCYLPFFLSHQMYCNFWLFDLFDGLGRKKNYFHSKILAYYHYNIKIITGVLPVFWLFDPFDRLGGKKNVITARCLLTIITILRLSIYFIIQSCLFSLLMPHYFKTFTYLSTLCLR